MNWRSAAARAATLGFAAFLPVGLATMNRSIGFMDRGELAAAAATWGIAHPTGYPTLMLLAGALVHGVPLRPVLVLNVFAVVLVALGTACLTLLMDHVAARLNPELDESRRARLAFLGALATSFSVTWWTQANGFEVYALHCVMMPLVVLLAIRWVDSAADPQMSASTLERRRGFAFALVTGLSFTNHVTTALLAPGLIAYAAARLGPRSLLHRLPRLVPPFLLGLLPYAWLPLRAAMHPALDWNDPHSLRDFVVHVTARGYRTLMFGGGENLAQQVRYSALHVPWDFAWLGLAVVGAGALWIARRDRKLLLLVSLAALAGIGFAVNYPVGDLDQYLLTTTLALGLCLVAGLAFVDQRWGSHVAIAVGVALVALNLATHWRDCDERGLGVPEAFYRDLVGPLPRGALMFTDNWQAESPALYFQNVEHVRDDVIIVDPDCVRARWYLEELERRAPQLIARVPAEYSHYLSGLRDAEAGRPYDGRVVDAARRRFLTALALAAIRDRQVFSTINRTPELPAHAMRVPYHFTFRLVLDTAYVAEPAYHYAYRPWKGRMDVDLAMTCQYYAECRVGRALYEKAYGRTATLPLVVSAASFDPHIRPERVAPMAAGADRIVFQVAAYFDDLGRTLETLQAQARGRVQPRNPSGG